MQKQICVIIFIFLVSFLVAGEIQEEQGMRPSPYSSSTIGSTVSEMKPGYFKIACGFAEIDDFRKAEKYAKKIEDPLERDQCYEKVIREMINSGLRKKALKMIEKIRDNKIKINSYKSILKFVIQEENDHLLAIEIAELSDEEEVMSTAYLLIASKYINNEEIDKAIQYFQKTTGISEKLRFFSLIGKYFLDHNEEDKIIKLFEDFDKNDLQRVYESITNLAINAERPDFAEKFIYKFDNEPNQYMRLSSLAISYFRNGNENKAEEICRKIKDKYKRERVQTKFAMVLINKGKIEKGMTYIDSLRDIQNISRILEMAVNKYAESEQFDEALFILESIQDFRTKQKISGRIAFDLLKHGEMERAEKIIKELTNPRIISKSYSDFIKHCISNNDLSEIDTYLEKIPISYMKDRRLGEIAIYYSKHNKFEKTHFYADQIKNLMLKEKIKNKIQNIEERNNE